MELYEIFFKRVKKLCSAVGDLLHQDPACQDEIRLQHIHKMCNGLEAAFLEANQSNIEVEYQHHSVAGPDILSSLEEEGNGPLECPFTR